MNIEDKINELLDAANELRPLPDDDERKFPLAALIDKINALRAEQSRHGKPDPVEVSEFNEVKRGIENIYNRQPNPGEVEFNLPRRGRPPKDKQ